MNAYDGSGRRTSRAAVALALLLLAACDGSGQPAPVYLNGAPGEVSGGMMPPPAPYSDASAPRRIVVQRGQTLRKIAYAYHVPLQALIAANHLTPPYKIETGRHLTVPAESSQLASIGPAMSGGAGPGHLSPPVESSELRPAAVVPLDTQTRSAKPADGGAPVSAPMALYPPSVPPAAITPPTALTPPLPTASPANSAAASAPVKSATPPETIDEPIAAGGRFPWPVRGRVLASYGSAEGGGHNDGINIGAPKGAPIAAIDAGVVAYAGNELRGYGNLILIKHPSGWISAYAHCDLLLVKKGEKIGRGQIIARVGSTGSVSEPQLHFELRRGNRAVDPREYLAPLPSARKRDGTSSG